MMNGALELAAQHARDAAILDLTRMTVAADASGVSVVFEKLSKDGKNVVAKKTYVLTWNELALTKTNAFMDKLEHFKGSLHDGS